MVEIREVKTKKEQKSFLDFPLKMYKDDPYFVPPLYSDEKKIFSKNYVYYDTCEAVYYNAYKDGVQVGRISGILQRAANEKNDEKRVRFTRFDSVNDIEVARALFGAVESWAKDRGMDTIVGPLGFSDLEREGLLIEGFDKISTFEEQYNADYYGDLLEQCGYEKEVDWTESRLYVPENDDGTLEKMADFILKRYDLHMGKFRNINDFIRKYSKGMFELIDRSYENIYGTVPFTDGMREMLVDNFKLIVKPDNVAVILDKDEHIVCFGICFPSIGAAVQKSGGRLTPAAVVRLLHDINHPRVLDLGLVGVEPEYLNRGISSIFSGELIKMMKEKNIEYCETNLNLEDNYAIQNQWKRFREEKHKRRRSYVKKI